MFFAALASPSRTQAAPTYKWFGDVRTRLQFENRDLNQPRLSGRLRVRLGADITLDPAVKAVLRVATAKGNRSTNQPLGDSSEPGSPRRFFGLDWAYGEWAPLTSSENPVAASWFKFYLGRIPQLQIKPGGSQILLDDDVALEGAGFTTNIDLSDSVTTIFGAGSTWIRENYDTYYSVKNADNMINWAQVAVRLKTESQSLLFGFGFYNFTALQGKAFSDLSVGGTSFGNSERPAGIVKNEYLPREFFVEWKAPLGSMTSTVFAQHIVNTMTSDPNRAWWVGWTVVEKNVWDALIAFGQIESDAVPGIFTSALFAAGTTNSNGVQLSSRWYLSPALHLRLSQYFNRLEYSTRNLQYSRTHLDLLVSF